MPSQQPILKWQRGHCHVWWRHSIGALQRRQRSAVGAGGGTLGACTAPSLGDAGDGYDARAWRRGRVVRQRPAKPRTAVRIRSSPFRGFACWVIDRADATADSDESGPANCIRCDGLEGRACRRRTLVVHARSRGGADQRLDGSLLPRSDHQRLANVPRPRRGLPEPQAVHGLDLGTRSGKFRSPESTYLGRTICVSGLIRLYRGHAEVFASSPAQVAIA